MALFGGGSSWLGPLLGAIILSITNEVLTIFIKPEVARIIYGAMFMAVIIFMPDGIISFFFKGKNIKMLKGIKALMVQERQHFLMLYQDVIDLKRAKLHSME